MVEIFTAIGQLFCIVGGLLVALAIMGVLLWAVVEVYIRSSKQYKYYMKFRRSREYWEYRKQQDTRKQGGKNETRR